MLRSHEGRGLVAIQATAAQVETLFGVELHDYEDPGAPVYPRAPTAPNGRRTHRGFDGPVRLPAELTDIVTGLVGLDNRRLAHPRGSLGGDPSGAGYPLGPTVAGSYNFTKLTASDQTIGVIAPQAQGQPGTPPCYLPSDITSYINGLPAGFTTQPAAIQNINITIGTTTYQNNQSQVTGQTPATASNNILELTQDLSTSAGIAQGATINVYFTEWTENGFLEFFNRVLIPDPGENQPGVVTMSFGINLGDDASGTSAYTGIGSLSDTSSLVYLMNKVLTELAGVGVSQRPGRRHARLLSGHRPCGHGLRRHGARVLGGKRLERRLHHHLLDFWRGEQQLRHDRRRRQRDVPGPGLPDGRRRQRRIGFERNQSRRRRRARHRRARRLQRIFRQRKSLHLRRDKLRRAALRRNDRAPEQRARVRLGAFNTVLYALKDVAFNDIQSGDNDPHTTPANVKLTIPSYTGNTPDPAFFKAGVGWDACTGLGSVDGAKLLNGIASLLYNSTFYFQVNKGSYGLDEVKGNLSYSNPTPMWLVLEGFTPNAVTAAGVTPSVISSVTGITVAVQTAQPELPSQPNTPQRIFYPCTVQFTAKAAQSQSQGGVFPNSQNPPVSLGALLVAPSISVGGQLLPAAETTLILDQGADPYFANYANNGYFYVSQDLRVFTVCPGIPAQSAPIEGIPLSASDPHNWDTGAAYSYIQAQLTHLNSTYADPTSNAFAQFPDQSNALSGDSSVTPTQLDPANPSVNTPFANYNFAVARVRVNGTANTTTTSNVRVLFRLFATQTSDTDYNTLTYASTLDADQQPLAPTLGSGDVTIPFFATGNYEANSDFGVNTDYSGTSSINNQPVTIGGSGEGFAYYGCYLNIYPTGNTVTTSAGKQAVQALLPSTHSCVVAQLVYDEAPYPTGSGVVLGPEWSANFAQRNLQITYSDNPGPAATHLVPQTFDVRPSQAPGSGPLENYPDELMIDWGNTPPGSQASIYWPAVASSDVLALADKFYSTHQLSASDAHTIACTVPQGITCVPIPGGGSENFAGLFSVQLPTGVSAGQAYTILVRRISTQAGAPPPPPPPPPPQIQGRSPQTRLAQATPAAAVPVMRSWRYVVGTFAIRIPVTTAKVMLPAEENIYSILSWAPVAIGPLGPLGSGAGTLPRLYRGSVRPGAAGWGCAAGANAVRLS